MKHRRPVRHHSRGFTLAEIAIVLVVLAVLAGALIVPIGGQIEARQRAEARAALDDIRAALFGFAILNGRLPCPARVLTAGLPGYGEESIDGATASCTATGAEGVLPWRTLGVAPLDPWGQHWRYRADRRFSDPSRTPIQTTHTPLDDLAVQDHDGAALTASGNTAVGLVYSLGANRAADGQNASFEAGPGALYQAGEPTTAYDDMVAWFGRPLLIARMAEAGAF
jgi:prepilin-type N-terminal cleavage/methylation domain-containing protein